jgi:phytoene dehydrogenase-like protein
VGVFERRSILGGAAVTEEFHKGFRNSTASYTVSLLNPKVIKDLRLVEHGLKVLERPMQNFLPLPDGRALTAGPAQANTLASVRSFSVRDAERLPAYYKMLDAAVALLRSQLLETPPADPRRLRDLWGALQMARSFRKLDATVQRDIHELFTRSAGDLLDHWFETDAVKALYGSTPWLATTRALAHRQRPCAVAPCTTLAPKGVHVASLYCQHFPYKLPGGRDWHQERARAVDLIFSTVESYAPDFRARRGSLGPQSRGPRRKTRPSRW